MPGCTDCVAAHLPPFADVRASLWSVLSRSRQELGSSYHAWASTHTVITSGLGRTRGGSKRLSSGESEMKLPRHDVGVLRQGRVRPRRNYPDGLRAKSRVLLRLCLESYARPTPTTWLSGSYGRELGVMILGRLPARTTSIYYVSGAEVAPGQPLEIKSSMYHAGTAKVPDLACILLWRTLRRSSSGCIRVPQEAKLKKASRRRRRHRPAKSRSS